MERNVRFRVIGRALDDAAVDGLGLVEPPGLML